MAEISDATLAPEAPQPPRKKRTLVIIIGAVVVGAGIAIGVAATGGTSTITVHGTIELSDLQYGDNTNPSSPANGDSCQGLDSESDIVPGTTVTIEGSSGQALGGGLLQAGVVQGVGLDATFPGGLCVMPFTVTVPAGQSQYAVAITGHGTQEYSQAQLEKGVTLTLG
jgi:hypothetical protein